MKYLFSFVLLSALVLSPSVSKAQDSLCVAVPDTAQADSVLKKSKIWEKGFVGKVLQYFAKANAPKPLDKVDFGIIGGPFYDKTSGFGIGISGTCLYHLQPTNPQLPQSSVSLTAKITTKGMFELFGRGYNYLKDDRFRSDYEIDLLTFRQEFWGLGFTNCNNNDNNSLYTSNRVKVNANFLFRLARKLYLGPSAYYSLSYADKRDDKVDELLGDRPHHTSTLGIGLTLRFDNRDNDLSTTRGCYLNLEQRVQPTFLGNHNTFTTTELQFKVFTPLWKGAVLGGELHSMLNFGNDVPWTEYAQVGSIFRMRGYYRGRYTDRNIIEGQIELRQHIKGRHSAVLWGGFANTFYNTHTWQFSHTLPNYGVGYRWGFKKNVNIRLDLGFTNKSPGFIFSVGEAF